jgi:hypothetical protein
MGYVDTEAILLLLSVSLFFAPFYIPGPLAWPSLFFQLGLITHFCIFLGFTLTRYEVIPQLFADPYPASSAVLLMIASLPWILSDLTHKWSRFFLFCWLSLIPMLILTLFPWQLFTLFLGLLVLLLTLRSIKMIPFIFFSLFLAIMTINMGFSGGDFSEKWQQFFGQQQTFQRGTAKALTLVSAQINPANDAVGLSRLRQILSEKMPGHHFNWNFFYQLPATILLPYAWGILFALMYQLLLLIILFRLLNTVKKTPRNSDERLFTSGMLALFCSLIFLTFFSSTLVLRGGGAVFFYLVGISLQMGAGPIQLIPKKNAAFRK